MIKLIVTNGGYVESSQYATILWQNNNIYAPDAKTALTSLSTFLLFEYVSEWLRFDFDPPEFEAWVYDLVSLNCNDGLRSFNGEEPWQPYISFQDARKIKKKECLIVPEFFEEFVVTLANPVEVNDALEENKSLDVEDYKINMLENYSHHNWEEISFIVDKEGYNLAVPKYNHE